MMGRLGIMRAARGTKTRKEAITLKYYHKEKIHKI